jgi:hypothetical protein
MTEHGSISYKRNRVGSVQTLEHCVADVVVCAYVAPSICDRAEEPVRRGELGGNPEEL